MSFTDSGGWDVRPPMVQAIRGQDGVLDPIRRQVTFHFGYWPEGARNNQLSMPGFGAGGYCELSGIHFPSSRLVQQYDGRMVGDIFAVDPNPLDYQ